MAEQLIELREYETAYLPKEAFSEDTGEILYRRYSAYVSVEFPSPKTNHQWALTSQGVVGHIPLTDQVGLRLTPKVPLSNLFGMLEYAYRLDSFKFLEDLTTYGSLDEFYSRLATVLAKRILRRGRKGFYRSYQAREEPLSYITGQLDLQYALRHPLNPVKVCHYEDHTADLEENQILAWTLFQILRSGLCNEEAQAWVCRAYHALQGLVSIRPVSSLACINRLYNRLNDDYGPLHALCRFFLEHAGPSHNLGRQEMLPFLVNMARLYELFVAEWLKQNLPADQYRVGYKEQVRIGQHHQLEFEFDLVLYDAKTDQPLRVLDTKYKQANGPAPGDVAQIVTYALVNGCTDAVLVYPTQFSIPFNAQIGKETGIRVRSAEFRLDGDLEQAGQAFLVYLRQLPARPDLES